MGKLVFIVLVLNKTMLAITREGDKVKIGYIDDPNGAASIISFDNLAFSEKISEEQLERDKLDEGTSALDSTYSQIVEVNPEMNEETWNGLSEEEKAEVIEKYLNKKIE